MRTGLWVAFQQPPGAVQQPSKGSRVLTPTPCEIWQNRLPFQTALGNA